MKIEDYIEEHNSESYSKKITLNDIMTECAEGILDAIDNSLISLADDVISGSYSNEDIVNKIYEIRQMII